ncbi:MAG: hypothetical protein AB7G40_05540 [Hyphomonadaceae bacterium]
MPDLASLFSDLLLEPVWLLLGVDRDSLLGEIIGWVVGTIVSALGAGLLILLALLWRAMRRYRDSRAIAEIRDQAPTATVILVSDFAGKGGEAWGRNIVDRLQPDFDAMSGGSSARLHRWTQHFITAKGSLTKARFQRSVARARATLKSQRADVLIWGRYTGAAGLRLHMVTSSGKGLRPEVNLDFNSGGQAKLTQEMGDAIAFFAAEAVGKGARALGTLDASALVTLALKLHAIATKPPRGLAASQIEKIEAAFDMAGCAAIQRAFPPSFLTRDICDQRLRKAESIKTTGQDVFAEGWANWAEIAVEVVQIHKIPKVIEVTKAARMPETRARLHIAIARSNVFDSTYSTDLVAEREAEAVLSLPASKRTQAEARIWLSMSLTQQGGRTQGADGLRLLNRAWNVASASIQDLTPASVVQWAYAHNALGKAALWAMGRLSPSESLQRFATTRDALCSALRSLNVTIAPRCASIIESQLATLLNGAAAHLPNSLIRETITLALESALNARSRAGKEVAPAEWAYATTEAAKALSLLGKLEGSPQRLKRAADLAADAATVDPLAFEVSCRALLARAEILANAAHTEDEARADVERSLQLIPQFEESHSIKTDPRNLSILASHRAKATELMGRLASEPKKAAQLYRKAASVFASASQMAEKLGERRLSEEYAKEAARCENLAAGENRGTFR